MNQSLATQIADIAADSPLSYEQMNQYKREGRLGAVLLAMTPKERIGAAAEVALRMGKSLSHVQFIFSRVMDEAA